MSRLVIATGVDLAHRIDVFKPRDHHSVDGVARTGTAVFACSPVEVAWGGIAWNDVELASIPVQPSVCGSECTRNVFEAVGVLSG